LLHELAHHFDYTFKRKNPYDPWKPFSETEAWLSEGNFNHQQDKEKKTFSFESQISSSASKSV
jgi:hypothetical protein